MCEWKPPRCDLCKIFGHVHDHFLKKALIPSTIVSSNVPTPTVEMTKDGFQTVGKKKKGKSKSLMVVSFVVTRNHPPKATVTSTKEGKITMSNSFTALDDKSDEDVENVFDKSANLFHSTKTGESSSTFTATAG
ncbi:hypothetical protein Tco_0539308 [Tanacetum coccineum]